MIMTFVPVVVGTTKVVWLFPCVTQYPYIEFKKTDARPDQRSSDGQGLTLSRWYYHLLSSTVSKHGPWHMGHHRYEPMNETTYLLACATSESRPNVPSPRNLGNCHEVQFPLDPNQLPRDSCQAPPAISTSRYICWIMFAMPVLKHLDGWSWMRILSMLLKEKWPDDGSRDGPVLLHHKRPSSLLENGCLSHPNALVPMVAAPPLPLVRICFSCMDSLCDGSSNFGMGCFTSSSWTMPKTSPSTSSRTRRPWRRRLMYGSEHENGPRQHVKQLALSAFGRGRRFCMAVLPPSGARLLVCLANKWLPLQLASWFYGTSYNTGILRRCHKSIFSSILQDPVHLLQLNWVKIVTACTPRWLRHQNLSVCEHVINPSLYCGITSVLPMTVLSFVVLFFSEHPPAWHSAPAHRIVLLFDCHHSLEQKCDDW